MIRALILLFLTLPLAVYSSPCSKANDTKNMCPGFTFLAEEAGDKCVKNLQVCKAEGKTFCHSGKVDKVECFQQYGGVWMTK